MNLIRRFGQLLWANRSSLLILAFMVVFRSSYADWMIVPSGSMNPTIVEGDYIFANKHAYGWRVPFTTIRITHGDDPQRGDVAIFHSPVDGTRLVKRVIGIPGDVVEMRDEVLYLNSKPLRYADAVAATDILEATQQEQPQFLVEQLGQVSHTVMLLPNRMALRDFAPIRIPEDQYLMLGDNRDNSADSRYIGLVSRDRFTGRAHHVLVSFNPEHYYLPRLDRLWKPLS